MYGQSSNIYGRSYSVDVPCKCNYNILRNVLAFFSNKILEEHEGTTNSNISKTNQ